MRNGNDWQSPSSKEAEELLRCLKTEEGESYIGRASRLLGIEKGRKRIMNILNGNVKMSRPEYQFFNDIVNGEK